MTLSLFWWAMGRCENAPMATCGKRRGDAERGEAKRKRRAVGHRAIRVPSPLPTSSLSPSISRLPPPFSRILVVPPVPYSSLLVPLTLHSSHHRPALTCVPPYILFMLTCVWCTAFFLVL